MALTEKTINSNVKCMHVTLTHILRSKILYSQYINVLGEHVVSIVRILLLKMESVISLRDMKYPLEINLIRIIKRLNHVLYYSRN
jgi:hypothetical protein